MQQVYKWHLVRIQFSAVNKCRLCHDSRSKKFLLQTIVADDRVIGSFPRITSGEHNINILHYVEQLLGFRFQLLVIMIQKTEKADGIQPAKKKYSSERGNFVEIHYALQGNFIQNVQMSTIHKKEQETAVECHRANKDHIEF